MQARKWGWGVGVTGRGSPRLTRCYKKSNRIARSESGTSTRTSQRSKPLSQGLRDNVAPGSDDSCFFQKMMSSCEWSSFAKPALRLLRLAQPWPLGGAVPFRSSLCPTTQLQQDASAGLSQPRGVGPGWPRVTPTSGGWSFPAHLRNPDFPSLRTLVDPGKGAQWVGSTAVRQGRFPKL